MHQGILQGAVRVSDEQGGEQNSVDNIAVEINMDEVGNSETTPGVGDKEKVDEVDDSSAVAGDVLVVGNGNTSVLDEAVGGPLGGRAESEVVLNQDPQPEPATENQAETFLDKSVEITDLESVVKQRDNSQRVEMVKETLFDETLAPLRKLADDGNRGYFWEAELLFRSRLDDSGQNIRQLCLPKGYRDKVLTLAHDNFEKVAIDLGVFFYWPSLWRDTADHCRSCDTCQRNAKAKPRPNPMVRWELDCVPSEKVYVDLVGPFPRAKNGYIHLLTYIDSASRWPEAIPLRSTTTQMVLRCLVDIFTRNGFPGVLMTDMDPSSLVIGCSSSVRHIIFTKCRLPLTPLSQTGWWRDCMGP